MKIRQARKIAVNAFADYLDCKKPRYTESQYEKAITIRRRWHKNNPNPRPENAFLPW